MGGMKIKCGCFKFTALTGNRDIEKGAIVLKVAEKDIFKLGAALEEAGFNVRREGDELIVHSSKPLLF